MSTIDETTKLAIEAVAKAKVAEALGGDVIAKLVDEVMRHTDRPHYGSDKPKTFFDKIVRECLEAQMRQAVLEHLRDNQAFKEKVSEALKSGADKFATSVIEALVTGDWRANMKITFKDDA